jgi:hypothetical protein
MSKQIGRYGKHVLIEPNIILRGFRRLAISELFSFPFVVFEEGFDDHYAVRELMKDDCENGADSVPGVMWMAAEAVETGMWVDGEAGWQERSGYGPSSA